MWHASLQHRSSLVAQTVQNLPAMWETWVQSLGREDPLEKGMATHSSILAWRIPWTEEPGGPHPWGRKGQDWSEWARMHAGTRLAVSLRRAVHSVTHHIPPQLSPRLSSSPVKMLRSVSLALHFLLKISLICKLTWNLCTFLLLIFSWFNFQAQP